jgi:internalin A
LELLRESIIQVVSKSTEIRMQFPAGWFRVKERLELMSDEFMGYEKFCELCHIEGVEDDIDRDTLCYVLHCLGDCAQLPR